MRRILLLVVVAHWIIAVAHLFVAARVLPTPNDTVSWVAITLITVGHLGMVLVSWRLSEGLTGLVSLLFFLAALGADLYEHFLHASGNNVFMLPRVAWTVEFVVSVVALLALEVIGLWLGILLLRKRSIRNKPIPSQAA